MTVLCNWIIDVPEKWASCVRLARTNASMTTRNQASVNSHLRPIHAMLNLVGVPSPPWADRPTAVEDCEVSDVTLKCQDCPSVFNTLQSLQRHRTSQCPRHFYPRHPMGHLQWCMLGLPQTFPYQIKLHRHLQYTHAGITCCHSSIAGTYPPINDAIVATEYCKKRRTNSKNTMRSFAAVFRLSESITFCSHFLFAHMG